MRFLQHEWWKIPGWFDFHDVYGMMASEGKDGDIFVEVGSWLGRSTVFMAVELSRRCRDVSFYAVDTWEGSNEPAHLQYMQDHDIYKEFIRNIGFCREWVIPVRKRSVEAAKDFADRSVSFLFLDGGHEYEDVRDDLEAWLPKMKLGGLIGGHDYNWPGVERAVRERFKMFGLSGASWLANIDGDHLYPGDFVI